jgi:hypothetical protein
MPEGGLALPDLRHGTVAQQRVPAPFRSERVGCAVPTSGLEAPHGRVGTAAVFRADGLFAGSGGASRPLDPAACGVLGRGRTAAEQVEAEAGPPAPDRTVGRGSRACRTERMDRGVAAWGAVLEPTGDRRRDAPDLPDVLDAARDPEAAGVPESDAVGPEAPGRLDWDGEAARRVSGVARGGERQAEACGDRIHSASLWARSRSSLSPRHPSAMAWARS